MTLSIKILGSGCANCARLEANARDATATLGLDAQIEKVTDVGEIASYGIMRTAGLVVDEQVLVSGRVPDTAEIARLLSASA
jgi:small redox-active disulfide protein 2